MTHRPISAVQSELENPARRFHLILCANPDAGTSGKHLVQSSVIFVSMVETFAQQGHQFIPADDFRLSFPLCKYDEPIESGFAPLSSF